MGKSYKYGLQKWFKYWNKCIVNLFLWWLL